MRSLLLGGGGAGEEEDLLMPLVTRFDCYQSISSTPVISWSRVEGAEVCIQSID